MITTLRDAGLDQLAELLKDQHARKVDVVVPSTALAMMGGDLYVAGAEPLLEADGVTEVDGLYVPTAVFDEGLSSKLEIPLPYLRRMREQRPDILDANVNGWLGGDTDIDRVVSERTSTPDGRNWLVRLYRMDEERRGVARAFLSDSYKVIDNFDVLMAAMQGVRDTGQNIKVVKCNLSERRMQVRLAAPGIYTEAESLLAEYRSPFRDPELDAQRKHNPLYSAARAMETWGAHSGEVTDPIIFAGLDIGNSENGNGAYSVCPVMIIKICNNGARITLDQLRRTHLGAKLDEGVINWSDATQQKNLELITSMTTDAVGTFLSGDYLRRTVEALEEKAGVKVSDPGLTIKTVSKKLAYDEATAAGILDHFIRGGQMTAGGVLQAVTSYAQVLADPDKSYELENTAVRALELAATA